MTSVKLSRPPEPTYIKKQTNNQLQEKNLKVDSLLIWLGNKLPSYLWREAGWSKTLKKEGFNWQSFLKLLSLHKKDMIKWLRNGITWNELLIKIEETIKDPIIKNMIT